MRNFLFLLIAFYFCAPTMAQMDPIDSLQEVLNKLENKDTTYVNVANDIAFRLSMTDQQKSIYYINLALSVSKKINYEEGIVRAITIKGNSFLIIGMPDQALSYYLEALNYHPEQYTLEYVKLNNNIGEVYRRKELYDSSLKYFNKALNLAIENIKDYQPIIIYSNLGEVSLMQKNFDKAKTYFMKCLENAKESGDLRGQGYGYYGLAECAYAQEDAKKAIDLMKMSIDARMEAEHQRGIIQSYLKIGTYFNSDLINQSDSAIYYWNETEKLADSYRANDLLNEVYDELYNFYLKKSDIPNAALYLNLHKNLSDSIRNAEFISNVGKIRSALQAELLNAENELLRKENQRRKAEEDARLIVITLAFLIVLGLGIATYQYRKRQKAIHESETESSFTNTLLALSKDLNERDISLNQFIKNLLTLSKDTLLCDRATYWALNEENGSIYLHSIVQTKTTPEIPPAEFRKEQFPKFFNDFLSHRTVAVSQISEDDRLTDIYEMYFKPSGIESILNAPIVVDGKFVGFISYTMTRSKVREWNVQEQRYVGSLADLIVVAIAKKRANMLEREKEELIRKLQTRNKSLQEFNNVVSHNLREPLTQIIGLAGLLQDGSSNGESEEIVSRIADSSNRVDRVIKELSIILNEKDPRAGDFRLLSLEKILKEVIDLLKSEIKSRNVTVEQNLEVKKIKSYKPYLVDALYHLISNSIKFANPSQRLQIEIRSYEDDFKQYLVISDNGRGMDLGRFGDKIFKMYQRYHMDVDGRGIGLFIVKNRVNVLNGFIKVESEEGLGTAFSIEFPKHISMLN